MPTDVTAACKELVTNLTTIQRIADRHDNGARMRGYPLPIPDRDVAKVFGCHTRITSSMLMLPTGFDSSFCAALHYPQIVSIGGVSALTWHSMTAELGRRYLARWGHLPRLPMEAVLACVEAVLACGEIVHGLCGVIAVDRLTPDGFDPAAVLVNLEREALALGAGREQPEPAEPAWRRLVVNRNTVTLDGQEYRLAGTGDDVFLEQLQAAKGETIKGETLQRECNVRPDRILKRLPDAVRDIVDAPGRGQTGYRMR